MNTIFLWSFCHIALGQSIGNGSFENALVNPGNQFEEIGMGSNELTDWVIESGNIDYIGTYWVASDGIRSVDLNASAEATIAQAINTVIGQTYFIEFDFSGNPVCGSANKTMRVTAANNAATYIFNIPGQSENNMGWVTKQFEFVATATTTTLRFTSLTEGFCGPAIDNVKLVDCAGTPNGNAVIDECGVCLEASDPDFNQSCIDCMGVLNGNTIIDACGECLVPNDPDFNACLDCAGTPNGLAIIDECGACNEPNDPNFNACFDCTGVPFGTAQTNECGDCFDPSLPIIDQLCDTEKLIYIPNIFSPNGDGSNDAFQIYEGQGIVNKIRRYSIYNRWGAAVFESLDFEITSNANWWDGRFKGEPINQGIFIYFIEVAFRNGTIRQYTGDVTVMN